MKTVRIINERIIKAGYILRTEEIEVPYGIKEPNIVWQMAYSPDGHYIGDKKLARHLCVVRGISPMLASPTHNVCSIGFSTKDGKWYGWSHRAICGFRIGSKHKHDDGSITVAKTVAESKKMAMDFARSVS